MLINCPVCESFVDADIFKSSEGKELETRIICTTCTFEHQYWMGVRRISWRSYKYQIHDDGNGDSFSNTHIPMKVLFSILAIRREILKWISKHI